MFQGSECNWVRENLSPYIDDQLAIEERRRVEAHLVGCAHCQEELASLRATVALLQRLPEAVPRRAFTLAAAELRRPSPAFTFFRLATALAALLLLVVLSGDVLEGLGYLPAPTLPTQMAPSQADEGLKAPPAASPKVAPGEGRRGAATEGPEAMGAERGEAELPGKPMALLTPTAAPEAPQGPGVTSAEEDEGAPLEVAPLLPWRPLELGLGILVVVLGGGTLWLAWRG